MNKYHREQRFKSITKRNTKRFQFQTLFFQTLEQRETQLWLFYRTQPQTSMAESQFDLEQM